MNTSSSSRENILFNIRLFLPEEKVDHPQIPVFPRLNSSLRSDFEQRLRAAGGASQFASNDADTLSRLRALHPDAKVICSAVPEIPGTRRAETIRDPHELADVDVGVIRAQFGVAETGAVWLTEEDLIVNGLGFLSQHLVILLDPNEIAADMHAAYARVRLDQTAYGCFMMGPSATGDIEATLVRGAQGPRSLNLFFLSKSSG